MMYGHLEEVIAKVLKKKSLGMLLTVGRYLKLLIVQFSLRWSKISVFLFNFLLLTLFFTFTHIITPLPHLTSSKSNLVEQENWREFLQRLIIFVCQVIIITVMLGEKRYHQQHYQHYANNNSTSQLPPQTPRNRGKPNIPLPNSRRSITPSRVQERVSTSPLRAPLEKAIQKCTRQKSLERPNSRSRVTNRSSRQGDSSIIYRRGVYEEEQQLDSLRRYHNQTINFLKKYFDYQYPIAKQHFMDRIIQEYGSIWSEHNSQQFLNYFTWKVVDLFGEYIVPRDLLQITQNDGMIGLILQICQHIQDSKQSSRSNYTTFSKSPNIMSINKSFQQQVSECMNIQHLKNILQQFMQTMYHEMEKQIYDRFNIQMKRMVLKHKETDRMLKKINQKIIGHVDFFQAEKKWVSKVKGLEEEKKQLERKVNKIEEELKKEKQNCSELKSARVRLDEEIIKLKESNQKYQNILLSKFENTTNNQNSVPMTPSAISYSRKIPSNGPLVERTQDYCNQNNGFQSEPKPFHIKIDTQFIHRDSSSPLTQTTTTFMDKNANGPPPSPIYPLSESSLASRCYSPIKINSQAIDSARPSFDGGIKPGTKIGEHIYSPYLGKGSRIN